MGLKFAIRDTLKLTVKLGTAVHVLRADSFLKNSKNVNYCIAPGVEAFSFCLQVIGEVAAGTIVTRPALFTII